LEVTFPNGKTRQDKHHEAHVCCPKKTASPLAPEPAAPVVEGSLDAVQIHRGRAGALRLDEVQRFSADPHLAHHNILAARAALLAARADIDATGFTVDWSRVEGVESLALAVIYAAGRVPADPRTTGEVRALPRGAPAHAAQLAVTSLALRGEHPPTPAVTSLALRGEHPPTACSHQPRPPRGAPAHAVAVPGLTVAKRRALLPTPTVRRLPIFSRSRDDAGRGGRGWGLQAWAGAPFGGPSRCDGRRTRWRTAEEPWWTWR
jgi:hypothetical protein